MKKIKKTISNIRKKFTIWYCCRGYSVHYANGLVSGMDCPFLLKTFRPLLSISVYFVYRRKYLERSFDKDEEI